MLLLCKSYESHKYTLWENAQLLLIKAGGTYSYSRALRVKIYVYSYTNLFDAPGESGTWNHPNTNQFLYGLCLPARCLPLKLLPDCSCSCSVSCGRFHEPDPKQRDQQKPWSRAVRYSVGRAAVCTHRQQSPRVSATRAREVWTNLRKTRYLLGSISCTALFPQLKVKEITLFNFEQNLRARSEK
jgi:hypothetical protein